MTQQYVGIVTDEAGFDIEVWIDKWDDKHIDHVFLMYGGRQVGDFPFNSPNTRVHIETAAQRVAAGECKHLSVMVEDGEVIDDGDIVWH